ncbi:MAG: hypothetical protein ACT4P6_06710 [Gemmatimonadaceae bacterium]
MTDVSAWLDAAATRVFALCAMLFVVMNAGAVALVVARRDRGFVNRWTARWLGANLAVIGAGVGVPIAAKVVRMTADAFAASRSLPVPNSGEPEEQQASGPPER